MWGGRGRFVYSCPDRSEALVRPEAVRVAGETGSDTKVAKKRLGIKMPSWFKRVQRRAHQRQSCA